jgi:hypothetical protein
MLSRPGWSRISIKIVEFQTEIVILLWSLAAVRRQNETFPATDQANGLPQVFAGAHSSRRSLQTNMSILWVIVFALLLGIAIYLSFYTWVRSARLVAACVFMAAFTVIVQNLETISHIWSSAGASSVPFFSDNRPRNVLNSNEHSGPVADVAFQSIIREDQNFLDEFAQRQTGQSPEIPTPLQVPGLAKELDVNTLHGKRAAPVSHKETVKRAQLVIQNEASRHAELVRSGQR